MLLCPMCPLNCGHLISTLMLRCLLINAGVVRLTSIAASNVAAHSAALLAPTIKPPVMRLGVRGHCGLVNSSCRKHLQALRHGAMVRLGPVYSLVISFNTNRRCVCYDPLPHMQANPRVPASELEQWAQQSQRQAEDMRYCYRNANAGSTLQQAACFDGYTAAACRVASPSCSAASVLALIRGMDPCCR